jgi:putative membrane protein insertion efficiency factor
VLSRLLILLVDVYRATLSPILGPACRYEPSCSVFMQQAIRAHGALRGSWLGVRRILRCHPWAQGGYDPVPPAPRVGGSTHNPLRSA